MKKVLTSLFLIFFMILICNISSAEDIDPFKEYVSSTDEIEDVLYTNINNEEYKEIVVINTNGVSLRNGPSNNYFSEVEKIPKGTVLKGYLAKDYESILKWVYAEYNGKKGWINCENSDVGYKYIEDKNIILVEEISIYNDSEMTSAIGKIKSDTIINTKDMISTDFSNFFKTADVKKGFNIDDDGIMKSNYINYDGKEGYITFKNYGVESSGTYTVDSEGIALYREPNDNSKVLVKSIPVGTVLNYTYSSEMIHPGGTKFSYGFWAYTDYKGKKGWVQAVEQELLNSQKEVIDTINSRTDETQNSTLKLVVIVILTVILVIAIIALAYRLKKYNNLGKK